jgi:hypothetical protein
MKFKALAAEYGTAVTLGNIRALRRLIAVIECRHEQRT